MLHTVPFGRWTTYSMYRQYLMERSLLGDEGTAGRTNISMDIHEIGCEEGYLKETAQVIYK